LVDSTTAESGVALALKMAPLLASNAEKELEIIGKTDQMLYDLQTMWLPAYEGVNLDGVIVESRVDNPLPRNKGGDSGGLVASDQQPTSANHSGSAGASV
jgi:hypothetical protein